jgi:hypothetical protein
MSLGMMSGTVFGLPSFVVLIMGLVMLASRGRDLAPGTRALMWAGVAAMLVGQMTGIGFSLAVARLGSQVYSRWAQAWWMLLTLVLTLGWAAGLACLIIAPFRAGRPIRLRSGIPPSPLTPSTDI